MGSGDEKVATKLSWTSGAAQDGDQANWLPIPKGPFSLLFRVYGPKGKALDGTYVPPKIHRTAATVMPRARLAESLAAGSAQSGKPASLRNVLRLLRLEPWSIVYGKAHHSLYYFIVG